MSKSCVVRTRRALLVTAVAAATYSGVADVRAEPPACAERVLVLAAMPLELSPLLRAADVDSADTVRVDDRTFYVGRLGATDVVLAMTGIGLVNAAETTTAAFEHFRCGFAAAVYSGVAGSRAFIGDVMIPARWTIDQGDVWFDVDPEMLSVASHLQGTEQVDLTRDVPVGDAACLCPGVDAPLPVRLAHEPKVRAGGSGTSTDQFGGKALPCIPGGGDVAGCEPCLAPGSTLQDALDFASNAPDLADSAFIEDFLQPPEQTTSTFEAQDMETAAFAEVATRYGVPFLGIRAVSDGQGDPLGLPGFPFQFFAYRQLAANNAAATTVAFLDAWTATRAS